MKYKIDNPDRGVWDVYVASEYDAAANGVNMLDTSQYAAFKRSVASARVATFKTRKAAREYVTNIGGTY